MRTHTHTRTLVFIINNIYIVAQHNRKEEEARSSRVDSKTAAASVDIHSPAKKKKKKNSVFSSLQVLITTVVSTSPGPSPLPLRSSITVIFSSIFLLFFFFNPPLVLYFPLYSLFLTQSSLFSRTHVHKTTQKKKSITLFVHCCIKLRAPQQQQKTQCYPNLNTRLSLNPQNPKIQLLCSLYLIVCVCFFSPTLSTRISLSTSYGQGSGVKTRSCNLLYSYTPN